MKNKSIDLHDHLFEALEWLGDRNIKGEELKEEIRRREAQCKVAQQIIANGTLVVKAAQVADAAKGKIKFPLPLTE